MAIPFSLTHIPLGLGFRGHVTLLIPQEPQTVCLELDEMYPATSFGALWSFVSCKANKRWIWLALCKQTRQVVACVIGGRGIATCRCLWQAIPTVFKQGTCFTNLWDAYQAVIPDEQHQAVGKETGLTAYIERFNSTIRQRLARFVRKTLSFSKSDKMHLICLHLFLHRYNLERVAVIR